MRADLDSRLNGYNGKVTHPTMPLERTYCHNCGCEKGWVTQESADFIEAARVQVLCDDCDILLGPRPELQIPITEF